MLHVPLLEHSFLYFENLWVILKEMEGTDHFLPLLSVNINQ